MFMSSLSNRTVAYWFIRAIFFILATSALAGGQCGSQIVLDGGPMKGPVRRIETTAFNQNAEVISRTTEEFDKSGHLVLRELQSASGSTISSTGYRYGHFGLLEAKTDSPDPKLRWTFKRRYSGTGLVLESFALNASGELSVVYLRDSMDETSRAISRTFCFGPGHPKELNERTLLLEYPQKGSETRLTADGVLIAKWWMERDKNHRVLRDGVGYIDLSFSKREFHADGTSFEHAFASSTGRHQFIWRNPEQRIVKAETAEVGQALETTDLQYDAAGRPWVILKKSGATSQVRTEFSYRDDEHGNWVFMSQTEGNLRKSMSTRAIIYYQPEGTRLQ